MRRDVAMKPALTTVLLLARAACAAAHGQELPRLDEVTGFEIPFDYDPAASPYITVQVSINGSAPLRFIVDTGVGSPFVIDTSVASRLLLPKTGATSRVKQGGLLAEEASLRSIKLIGRKGNAIVDYYKADLLDLSQVKDYSGCPGVSGFIGFPALSEMTSRFDFATHTLTLYTDKHLPYKPLGAAVLPITGLDRHDLPSVELGLADGVVAELEVDTGSADTSVPRAVAGRLAVLKTATSAHGLVDGSFGVVQEILVSQVYLGSHVERNVVVSVASAADPATIWLQLLSRFQITLDPRNRLMTLERGADYALRTRLEGSTGIGLERRGIDFVADDVDLGSPGDRAGVKNGDKVLSVDGKDLQGLPLERARALLRGTAGTNATIRISRDGGHAVEKRFSRVSQFDRKTTTLTGLSLWKPAKEPFTVEAVASGSAADRAGLRAGDKILSIDGKEAAGMTIRQFEEIDWVRPRLTVQRAGSPKVFVVVLESKEGVR